MMLLQFSIVVIELLRALIQSPKYKADTTTYLFLPTTTVDLCLGILVFEGHSTEPSIYAFYIL